MKIKDSIHIRKLGWLIISGLLVVGITGCGSSSYLERVNAAEEDMSDLDMEEADSGGSSDTSDSDATSTWVVQVSGAVNSPGVFEVEEGTRVYEVIALAGGLRSDAGDSLNQADYVSDGQKITVLTREEEESSGAGIVQEDSSSPVTSDGKVRINYASQADLMTLPGIGESKALDIITYREEHGAFTDTSELMQISGIKDGVYNKIKDLITVD